MSGFILLYNGSTRLIKKMGIKIRLDRHIDNRNEKIHK